jgi:DmsE family decaheme c-type cytochrome
MRFDTFATLLCSCLCAISLTAVAQQPAQEIPGRDKPICANCHEDKHTSISLTAHGAKNDASGSMCQACHGDATEHLKDPIKSKPANPVKTSKPAAERAAVCLSCHAGQRHLAFWESGKHAKNEVACSDCHSIHGDPAPDPTTVALKKRDPTVAPFSTTSRQIEADTCGKCHQQIRSAILKPSHHPIREGKVKCSDCHNPHGALSQAMVRHETVNQQCTSCHADKRGPYLFAHPVVEENCLTCHNPHGSSHGKLLNEAPPNLCQDCHDVARHPGTPYGAGASWVCAPGDTTAACAGKTGAFNANVNTRFIARACLNCHNSIHGSNAPGNRGQFLLR